MCDREGHRLLLELHRSILVGDDLSISIYLYIWLFCVHASVETSPGFYLSHVHIENLHAFDLYAGWENSGILCCTVWSL